jgi:hypothetical protein
VLIIAYRGNFAVRLAPGKPYEVVLLTRWNVEAFGQPESYLLGGSAFAQLDLLDGDCGAAHTLGEVFLG